MSDGQFLYEAKHPKYIRVYDSPRPWAKVLTVLNPEEPTPWHLLTKACQASWERDALTHYLTADRRRQRAEEAVACRT